MMYEGRGVVWMNVLSNHAFEGDMLLEGSGTKLIFQWQGFI